MAALPIQTRRQSIRLFLSASVVRSFAPVNVAVNAFERLGNILHWPLCEWVLTSSGSLLWTFAPTGFSLPGLLSAKTDHTSNWLNQPDLNHSFPRMTRLNQACSKAQPNQTEKRDRQQVIQSFTAFLSETFRVIKQITMSCVRSLAGPFFSWSTGLDLTRAYLNFKEWYI